MRLPILKPTTTGTKSLSHFLQSHRSYVFQKAFCFGAILFRGWDTHDAVVFKASVDALQLQEYDMSGSAAPRTTIHPTVFTSNDAPSDQTIPFHHELGQRLDSPAYIFFFCDIEPERDGSTPIVDSRELAAWLRDNNQSMHAKLRCGLSYRRVMPKTDDPTSPIGRSWKNTYGVSTRRELQDALPRGTSLQWYGDDVAETVTPPIPGIRTNKRSGQDTFVNSMVAARLGWNDKRNSGEKSVLFSDGTTIPEAFAQDVETRMEELAIRFEWEKGDILMIDNTVTMHARDPFTGRRRILASVRNVPKLYQAKDRHVTLPSWRQVPCLALDASTVLDTEESISAAIRQGVRHIHAEECARAAAGRGIAYAVESGIVERDDIWVTTTISASHPDLNEAHRQALVELGLSRVDLVLLECSSSSTSEAIEETWRRLELMVKTNLVSNIGVAHASRDVLDNISSSAHIMPCVNQIDMNLYNSLPELRAYCRESGIRIAARYSSTITSPSADYESRESVLEHENAVAVARRHSIPLADVLSAWLRQKADVSLCPPHDALQSSNDIELGHDEMRLLETFD